MRDERGKLAAAVVDSRRTAYLLARYGQRVRADFRRFYGVGLLDVRSAPEIVALTTDLLRLDSSLARALNDDEPLWQVEHYLLADLWGAQTGKPYPNRPKAKATRTREHDPQFLAARERARDRARERRRLIDSGEIT